MGVNASIKPKVAVKASVKPKMGVKGKVGVKVGAKRRAQAVASDPVVAGNSNGINTAAYASDVQGVPTSLSGDADQSAPAASSLIKIAIASFAIILAMF